MSIELLKENIDYEQRIGQNTSDTVVKEEYIIPDTQPDVKEILTVDAKTNILNTDIMQDKVYVEGNIEFNVLYLGRGDETNAVCGVTYASKFSNYVDIIGCEHDMRCAAKAYVEHMECNIVNERKISVEGIVKLEAEINKPCKIDMISDVVGIGEIQFLKKQTRLDKIIGKSSIDLIAKSNMLVPMDKPQVDEILKFNINVHKKQVKVLEGKVQVEAFAYVDVLYRDKGTVDINSISDDVLITGEGKIDEADPSLDYEANFGVDASEISLKEDDLGERRIISIDALVKCDMKLIKKEEMNIVDDAYSPQTNLKLQKQDYDVNMLFNHVFSETMAKENIEIPEGDPVPVDTIMANGKAIVTDKKIVENKVVIDGVVNANVVYKTSDAEKYVYAVNEEVPFNATVDVPGTKIDMICNADAYIENIEATVEAGTISVKAIVDLDVKVSYNEHKEFIVDVLALEGEMPKKKASITIYIVQKGDSLWKIAKRYCTTVENIIKANKLDNPDELPIGDKLLIPGRIVI